MAMIPLYQKCKISKYNGKDSWGKVTYSNPVEYPCRFDEQTDVVTDANGKEFIPTVTIYLEGLIDVELTDLVQIENELGEVIKRNPARVKVLRDFSGVPLFTVIYLK